MQRPGWRWVLLIIALGGFASVLFSDVPARWLILEDPPGPVDAAVALGGDPYYERTFMAAALVRSGQARLLILTGGEPGPGDSAASLEEKAIEWGVPPERIRSETGSRSTREEMLGVAPILRQEGIRSVALVTSPYHQRRAYLAARRAWPGVVILNRPASPSIWSSREWWRDRFTRRVVLSEYQKLLYYAVRGWL